MDADKRRCYENNGFKDFSIPVNLSHIFINIYSLWDHTIYFYRFMEQWYAFIKVPFAILVNGPKLNCIPNKRITLEAAI